MDRLIAVEGRSVDLLSHPPFQLGRARIDPKAHEYVIDGEATRIQPQALKVLIALRDKAGHVVPRDELIDRCWGGRVVGDDVITRCIFLLRPFAAESGGFRIETIPRAGYRLIETPTGASRRPSYPFVLAGMTAVVVLVGAFLTLRPPETSNTSQLAVTILPFNAEPGSHFGPLAAEVQDSVVRMLTESNVAVKVARAKTATDPEAVDLLVSASLSGDAQHPVAVVSIEDAKRREIVMSHRIKAIPADISDFPDQVGADLSAALSWTGPLILLDEQHPADPIFVSQFLDAASNEGFDYLRAYEFDRSNAAGATDSALAQLQFAMNTGIVLDALPVEDRSSALAEGLRAATRARRLAPHFGDVYIPWCILHSPVRMRECEDQLRMGLSAGRGPFIDDFLGKLMSRVGRTRDAFDIANSSLAQDQYIPNKIDFAAQMDEAVGDSADAQANFDKGTRLWPRFGMFDDRAAAFAWRGDFDGLKKFEKQNGGANLPQGYASVTDITRAVGSRSLPELRKICREASGVRVLECLVAFVRLGAIDDAFAISDGAYHRMHAPTIAEEERIWPTDQGGDGDPWWLSSPALTKLRADPRFLALAERTGLLDYWRSGRLPDFCTQAHEPECSKITGK